MFWCSVWLWWRPRESKCLNLLSNNLKKQFLFYLNILVLASLCHLVSCAGELEVLAQKCSCPKAFSCILKSPGDTQKTPQSTLEREGDMNVVSEGERGELSVRVCVRESKKKVGQHYKLYFPRRHPRKKYNVIKKNKVQCQTSGLQKPVLCLSFTSGLSPYFLRAETGEFTQIQRRAVKAEASGYKQ